MQNELNGIFPYLFLILYDSVVAFLIWYYAWMLFFLILCFYGMYVYMSACALYISSIFYVLFIWLLFAYFFSKERRKCEYIVL